MLCDAMLCDAMLHAGCFRFSYFLYFHSKLSVFSYFFIFLHSLHPFPLTCVRIFIHVSQMNTRYHVLASWICLVQLTSSHHIYHTYVRAHALSSLYEKWPDPTRPEPNRHVSSRSACVISFGMLVHFDFLIFFPSSFHWNAGPLLFSYFRSFTPAMREWRPNHRVTLWGQ